MLGQRGRAVGDEHRLLLLLWVITGAGVSLVKRFNSKAARRVPRDLWPIVRPKLDQIDAVTRLDDLRVPPGDRLHALTGDLRGWHAVRVNIADVPRTDCH